MLFNLGSALLGLLAIHVSGSVALPVELDSRANGIAQSTYDSLLRYAKFSSAAYQLICPFPLGTNLVRSVSVARLSQRSTPLSYVPLFHAMRSWTQRTLRDSFLVMIAARKLSFHSEEPSALTTQSPVCISFIVASTLF